MRPLRSLVGVGLLCLGFSSAAAAAPVLVTYDFSSGVGFAGWGSPSGSTASGMGGAQMVVLYADGSTTVGGSLGTLASVQVLQVNFTAPGTLLASPFGSMVVAGGVAGSLSVGGFWNFVGASAIAASALGPGMPSLPLNGNVGLVFSALGPSSIAFSGGGTQMFGGPGVTGSWTLAGMVGMEVSRVAVPEPVTGLLLVGVLAGLAAFGARLRGR